MSASRKSLGRRRLGKVIASSVATLLVGGGLAVGSGAVAAADPPGVTCSEERLEVSLYEGAPTKYEVFGELCHPATETDVVQLLVPGLTYDRSYWDFEYEPETYAYAPRALAAGYATFALDRIGTGRSSKPPALNVNFSSEAYVVHQVVQALRNGTFDGAAFGKVVILGHSGGSAISELEAARYHDVDAVVLTGYLHAIGAGLTNALTAIGPAQLDPVTSRDNPPLGYLTTLKGRRSVLYNPDYADPAVLEFDESTKQTLTAGEAADIVPTLLSAQGAPIDVPVYLVEGSEDGLFCGLLVSCDDAETLRSYSEPYYPNAPVLDVYVDTGSGHNLNLQLSAPQTFDAMLAWIGQHIPA